MTFIGSKGEATNLTLLRRLSMNVTSIFIDSKSTNADICQDIASFYDEQDLYKTKDFVVLFYARKEWINFLLRSVTIQPVHKHNSPNKHYLGVYNKTHLITDWKEDLTAKNPTEIHKNELAVISIYDFKVLCE